MHFNWIDWIILVLFGYALFDGWRRGFISLIAAFISFLGSLWFAVRYHRVVGTFFTTTFGLTATWTDVLGYLAVAIVSQLCIELVCEQLLKQLPDSIQTSKVNSWLGCVVSLLNTFIVMAFVLLLLLALPLRGTIKSDVNNSVIGNELATLAQQYGGQWRETVQDVAKNSTKFLTVESGSKESVSLDIGTPAALVVDTFDEQAMVKLVNEERTSRGLSVLIYDAKITKVAEAKSRDMFVRRYFSHYDPEGKSVADHFVEAGISFSIGAENLAYAPDLQVAHQGLMNSPGHRANILDSQFHRLGIGVIDGAPYGKIYTQEFTD